MMKRLRLNRPACLALLAVITLLALSYFPLSRISAANSGATILPSSGKPLVNFKGAQSLRVTYTGRPEATAALQSGAATPTSLAAADFNADGAIDVVAGYSTKNGGALVLMRGNPDAFVPKDTGLYQKAMQGKVPSTFLSNAAVFAVPVSPDMIVTGDFDRDGHQDVLVGARGGSLYLLTGDGRGNLGAAQAVPLSGKVMAMDVTGDGHVAVSLEGGSGPRVSILEPGKNGLKAGATYTLPARGDSVAWGRLGGGLDIAVGAGYNVAIIYGALTANSQMETVSVPFQVQAVTIGDFIWDRDGRLEISVLADDGTIHILQHGSLDTRSLASAETAGRRGEFLDKSKQTPNPTAMGRWSIAKKLSYSGSRVSNPVSSPAFNSPHLAGAPSEDLMVVDAGRSQLHIVDTSGAMASPSTDFSFAGTPVAAMVLPRKINAGQDMIVLAAGQAAPAIISFAPTTTFNVTTTTDNDDAGACTNTSVKTGNGPDGHLSLREATCEANNTGGSVAINVPAGEYDLSDTTGGETGELYLGTAPGTTISIVGQGATPADTVIKQTDGIDRIMEQDPPFLGGVDLTISNLTLTGGNCTHEIDGAVPPGDCTYGGGALLGGDATAGDVTLTNVVVSNNTANENALSENPPSAGSNGGGLNLSGLGTYSIHNSTFSSNTAAYVSPYGGGPGGGIFTNVQSANLTITDSVFTNNISEAQGGGALNYALLTGFTVTITGSTFTGNQAQSSNGEGGAIYGSSQGNGTSIQTTTISNSRFANNLAVHAATGIAMNGLTYNVNLTNNWWGCNAGPGTPANDGPLNGNGVFAPGSPNAGCDSLYADTHDATVLDTSSPLQLSISANPTQVNANGGTSTLTAKLVSSGTCPGYSSCFVPNGTPISFGGTLGTSSPSSTTTTTGQATSTYTAGSSSGGGTGTATVDNQTVSTPITVNPSTVQITITTSPANLQVSVDNGPATAAPLVETWTASSTHTIATTSPQAGAAGVQYVFSSWSDIGSISHTIQVPSSATTYTANFTTQYLLTATANPSNGGTVTPASPTYYNAGSTPSITASPAANFAFTAWSSNPDIANTALASTTITMNGPELATANFQAVAVAAPTTTSVSSSNNPSFTTPPNNSVTFTATVTSNSTVNEGTVTFSDPANNFTCSGGNTVPVSNGQAACTTSFTSEGANTISATYNGTANFQGGYGTVTQEVDNHTTVAGNQFCNTGAITVPSTVGAASPYPSRIFVSALTGNISNVTVSLKNLSSSDIPATDLLLQGPTGAFIIPFAGVGDTSTITNLNVTLDDAAAGGIPSGSPLVSGTFKPTSSTGSTSLVFPAPAPAANTSNYAAADGTATLATTFASTAPNGTWSLYAMANSASAASSIGGGWCVTITTGTPPAAPTITSANNATFTVGQANSFTIKTTGSPMPSVGESASTLDGLSFVDNHDGTGTLSGMPTVGGLFPITFTASNGVSPNATQSFTLTVNQAPTITSANNTTFVLEGSNSFMVTTTGYPAPTIMQAGALPNGVHFTDNLNGTGTLSGIPIASGVFHDMFTASNGVGSAATQNFALTVTGPVLNPMPPSIGFATSYLNGIKKKVVLTLQNTGSAPLSITGISITPGGGTGGSVFTDVNYCEGKIAAGKSCTVAVNFSPSQIGSLSGTLNITDNAPGSPQQVPLSAIVINPVPSFNPTSLTFTPIKVGTSATKTITVTNTGTTDLTISNIAVGGKYPSDFMESDNCSSPVTAGNHCTISVTFKPTAKGSRSANVTVTDNAQTAKQTVALSGGGQ